MSASIYDVAKKSGVSIATVSRVLNNPASVREIKRNRVLEVMQELNYAPSPAAQSLALSTTGLIGLSMPAAPYSMFDSAYLLEFYHGVDIIISRSGYDVVVINENLAQSTKTDLRCYDYIRKKKLDGIIFPSVIPEEHELETLLSSDFPLVYTGKALSVSGHHVYASLQEYVKNVGLHFYAHGHRRIGFLGCSNYQNAISALCNTYPHAAFEAVFHSHYPEREEIEAAVRTLFFERGVTACFIEAINIAPAILSALQKAGLSVPGDISIATVEHVPGAAAALFLPLDAVYVPALEMGASCANTLLCLLEGRAPEKREITFHPQIIPRGSTAQLRAAP